MGHILKEKWNYPDFVSRSTQPLCQGAANLLGHIISPSDYLKYDFFWWKFFLCTILKFFFDTRPQVNRTMIWMMNMKFLTEHNETTGIKASG